MLTENQIRPDQREAIDWLRYRTEAALLLPVGFGKTIVTLTALKEIFNVLGRMRVLVFSTKNIVEHTWPDEIKQWEHVQDFTYASAAGRNKDAVFSKPDVLGVNFENVNWFYDLCDANPSLLPEILVIDESSKMSSADANRVKRHCGFRRQGGTTKTGYVHKFKRRFALSATPNAEGYTKLWAQEACISNRRRLGDNITNFRNRYCSAWWNGTHNVYTVYPEAERAVEDALRPITYVAPNKKYMELEDPIESAVEIPWTPEAWEQYEKLEDTAVLAIKKEVENVWKENPELEGVGPDELARRGYDIVSAPNVGVLFNKLRQLCSGFVYNKKGVAVPSLEPGPKLGAMASLVERSAGCPVVVFTQFRASAEYLADNFRAHVGLPKSLEAWDRGTSGYEMLVLHPKSAGHGINLQHGSHVACWYELPWSHDEYHQGIGRLHRGGQRHRVSATRFIRSNSIELMVWDKLCGKSRTMDRFIENVR